VEAVCDIDRKTAGHIDHQLRAGVFHDRLTARLCVSLELARTLYWSRGEEACPSPVSVMELVRTWCIGNGQQVMA
jgi:hypothetical protein